MLVLGPTRELTDQILQVAKSLSHFAKFRSACVNGGGTGRLVTHSFFAPHNAWLFWPKMPRSSTAFRQQLLGGIFVLAPAKRLLFNKVLQMTSSLAQMCYTNKVQSPVWTAVGAVCLLLMLSSSSRWPRWQPLWHLSASRSLLKATAAHLVTLLCPDVLARFGWRCRPAGSAPHDITLQLCLCLPAAGTLAQQAACLAAPLDILVATPQKVLQHAEKGNLFYGDVQWLVLDEADTMLDRWAVTGCQIVQWQVMERLPPCWAHALDDAGTMLDKLVGSVCPSPCSDRY